MQSRLGKALFHALARSVIAVINSKQCCGGRGASVSVLEIKHTLTGVLLLIGWRRRYRNVRKYVWGGRE